MITIKEYARQRGKTVQAVYQQVKRKSNSEKLKGHIYIQTINDKETTMLDDEAVAILEKASSSTPVIIEQTDTKEQLEQLQQENKALLIKVAEQAEEYMQYIKETTLELQEIKAQLALAEKSQAELEAEKKETMATHQQAIAELKEQLEAEQGRKLSWSERFRGRKRKQKSTD